MMKFIKHIKTGTAKDSAILLCTAGLASGLGLVITVVLAKNLAIGDLGLFLASVNFAQIVIHFSELGLSSTLPHFVSLANTDKKTNFLKAILFYRLGTAFLAAIVVYLFAAPMAIYIFKDHSMETLIRYSAFGIPFYILITWEQMLFQARKKFLQAAIVISSINTLRLLLITLMIIGGYFTLTRGYLATQLVLILIVIAVVKFLKLDFLKNPIFPNSFKKVWAFSFPLGLGGAMVAIYTRFDQILVLSIAGQAEAGIYGVASRVASMLIYLSYALSGAVSPRFASLERKDFKQYFHKVLLGALILVPLFLLFIYISPVFLVKIFGTQFKASVAPFQILSLGAVLLIFSSLFSNAIVFQFKRTKFVFWISFISTFIILFLLETLTPHYKSVGAAISVTSIYVLQLVASICYYLWISNEKEEKKNIKVKAIEVWYLLKGLV